MELFLEQNNEQFKIRTEVYDDIFMPFAKTMKQISYQYIHEKSHATFQDYTDIVQWPVRKLEYSFILNNVLSMKKKGMRVLDAGCGVTPLPFILGYFDLNTVGIDFREEDIILMKHIARDKGMPGSEHVDFEVHDISKMSYSDETFDLITCVSVMEHMDFPIYIEALYELYRVLKPGGSIVITMDFWLGDSRKYTVTSGGFTYNDLMEIVSLFHGQIKNDGIENILEVSKEQIEAFWKSHLSNEHNFDIREYIAVGFTIQKSDNPKVIQETLSKIEQYITDQAVEVIKQRKALIDELNIDREARLQKLIYLTDQYKLQEKVIQEIDEDRQARLDILQKQSEELKRLKQIVDSQDIDFKEIQSKLEIAESDRTARLNVIELQAAQIEKLERDRQARLDLIEHQSKLINDIEIDRQNRLNTIEKQAQLIEELELNALSQLDVINMQDEELTKLRKAIDDLHLSISEIHQNRERITRLEQGITSLNDKVMQESVFRKIVRRIIKR